MGISIFSTFQHSLGVHSASWAQGEQGGRGGATVMKVGGFDPLHFLYTWVGQEAEYCTVFITSIMAYICLSAANEIT